MSGRNVVQTASAPAAIGPYSQAVVANGVVYCSGQIGMDPVSGELIGGGVEAQTRQVMTNLAAVIEAAGSDLSRVAKCMIYLTDMGSFAKVNEVYASFFKDKPPARACVEVSALPKGAVVEIDAIAVV